MSQSYLFSLKWKLSRDTYQRCWWEAQSHSSPQEDLCRTRKSLNINNSKHTNTRLYSSASCKLPHLIFERGCKADTITIMSL